MSFESARGRFGIGFGTTGGDDLEVADFIRFGSSFDDRLL